MECDGVGCVEAFLAECRQSGDSAYNALKGILERLDNVDTRKQARIFLAALQTHISNRNGEDYTDCLSTFHFNIHDLSLSSYEGGSTHEEMHEDL